MVVMPALPLPYAHQGQKQLCPQLEAPPEGVREGPPVFSPVLAVRFFLEGFYATAYFEKLRSSCGGSIFDPRMVYETSDT